MNNLTTKQRNIASLIQKDLAVHKYFFMETGNLIKLSGKEVLGNIKELRQKGYIRKFGAILRHQRAGYKENALVVWSVPAVQTKKMGEMFAEFSFISHCYQREPAFMDKYNIFTMLHSDRKNISSLIEEIVHVTGIKEYLILKSIEEYKKTSPEYF